MNDKIRWMNEWTINDGFNVVVNGKMNEQVNA